MQLLTCLCGGREFTTVFAYRAPPPGEVRFDFGTTPYSREIRRCKHCGHYLSVHDIDMQVLYSGQYVDATYGGEGLKRAFDRIVNLPEDRSDNVGRVEHVSGFARRHFGKMLHAGYVPRVLDVGSGLCVFLHRFHKLTGWPCTALDPDRRAVAHASAVAGVDGLCADFMSAPNVGRFDLITFNKVLEHVVDPIAMLARARDHIVHGGLVYVELPDGEAAQGEGFGREEFYIDHHHVFSLESIRVLAEKAGFRCEEVERLREPSSKFTLRAFLTVAMPGTEPDHAR
jgi:SAM-dependent methyltransferase